MNPHILSRLERSRINTFIKDKQETPAIRVIRSRARKNMKRLMIDLFLLALFLDEKELASYLNDQIDWEAP